MLLVADVGNTNVVFALYRGREIKTRWRIATDPRRTGDEYAVWLLQLIAIEGFKREDVTQIIVGSVVPRAVHNLTVLAQKYFGVEPLIAGQGDAAWGIAVDVDEPRSLGADRALNAIAAHAKYEGDLIVIDFGTATTFDAIDFNGAYKGGIIAPGINLSMKALHEAAAKLPRVAIQKPDHVIGRDTVAAMQSGVFWGYIDLIDGLVERIKAEYGQPMTVIATGGVASLFEGAAQNIDHFDGDITIKGLRILYDRNITNAAKELK
jgi:type III pantothenate kinase